MKMERWRDVDKEDGFADCQLVYSSAELTTLDTPLKGCLSARGGQQP